MTNLDGHCGLWTGEHADPTPLFEEEDAAAKLTRLRTEFRDAAKVLWDLCGMPTREFVELCQDVLAGECATWEEAELVFAGRGVSPEDWTRVAWSLATKEMNAFDNSMCA